MRDAKKDDTNSRIGKVLKRPVMRVGIYESLMEYDFSYRDKLSLRCTWSVPVR